MPNCVTANIVVTLLHLDTEDRNFGVDRILFCLCVASYKLPKGLQVPDKLGVAVQATFVREEYKLVSLVEEYLPRFFFVVMSMAKDSTV